MTVQQAKQQVDVAIEKLIRAREVFDEIDYKEAEVLANDALAILFPLETMPGLGEEKDVNSLRYTVIYHIAHAYNRLMVVSLSIADLISALDFGTLSIKYAERVLYYNRIAQIYSNFGALYMFIDEDLRAIEYCRKSLAIASEFCEIDISIDSLVNLGEAYRRNGDYKEALECSLKGYALAEEHSFNEHTNLLPGNIGVLYMDIGEYSHALEYLLKALQLSIVSNDKRHEAMWFGYLGRLYCVENFEGADAQIAAEYFVQSFAVVEDSKLPKYHFRKNYRFMAALLYQQGQSDKAYEYLLTFIELENEVKSTESKKEATKFDYAFKSAERDKNLAVERAEADATKRLLHKTLPKSIADRVIQGETRIADHFESVSILFADVVGFTQLSANLPPATVLGFMNFLFEYFDSIAEKFGCERIKTIGDGYLAVCGAPIHIDNHAECLANMALAMMEDISLPDEIREYLPAGTVFRLRIGLHCGEITAGLIGTGKLTYDIYGDAVNTAARMESHGEPGKIHVSEDFVKKLLMVNGEWLMEAGDDSSPLSINHSPLSINHSPLSINHSPLSINHSPLTINNLPLTIISRGEMEIKGKGKMQTYFLERT
ncbi:MAG: tetratricopeptide repeat protein [Ignavibacteria bacterium]|nr:tetratricopeptide repeat protein [Ignavibacteria bacterium]